MFKLIGAVAGYYFFGWPGAVLSLLLGAVIDRIRAYGSGAMNPLRNAIRQTVFLETVFISMGKLAKADGRVSPDEIDHVEQFMQKLGMTAEHRQRAIALFRQGVDPASDLAPVYQKFLAVCGHTRHLKEVLLVYLIVLALADGHYHPAEEALLTDIAARLGYGPAAFRLLRDMVLNQTHFAGGQPATAATAMDDAYKALGVSRDSSDAEIK
ncbi:MAG TPA: co-chaperone DjlA, partial [Gallionella sp.]|nr:co-chaperone DjlA [Gallionella sp.]